MPALNQKTNQASTYLAFRPRIEVEPDWFWMREWCKKHKTTMSAVFNTLIPLIKVACENTTEKVATTTLVDMNFGKITIK